MSKLYTEEQVKQIIDIAEFNKHLTHDEILKEFSPIQLPSDEEIENNAYSDRRVNDWENEQQIGFERGAKWMRDKIKGS